MSAQNTNPYSYPTAQAQADIVLRSSDGIDFYVVKPFLCYVSPFFKNLFDLGQEFVTEELDRRKGLPVVPVTETSETLRLLLDFIYPQEDEPQLNDAALFLNVAKAAQKYCMDKIENKFRKRIIGSRLVNRYPFRMYAIATDLGWDDVAMLAARQDLRMSLDRFPHVHELNNITGAGFYRFLEFRLRCESSSNPSEEQLMELPRAAPQCMISSLNPVLQSNGDISGFVDAPEPFDPNAISDIILRSADGVDFFVLEGLIRIVSSSPSPTMLSEIAKGQVRNGRVVIQMPEESSTLYHLLVLIYPYADQLDMNNCQLYIRVVLAIRRYEIAAIEIRLRTQAASNPLLSKEPLKMYIVASALGWDDLAKSAALNTLSKPLREMDYMEEFNLITGADLHRLVSFRFRCADAARNAIIANALYRTHGPGGWIIGPSSSLNHDGPTDEFFSSLKSCPRGSTVADAYKQETDQLGTFEYGAQFSVRTSTLYQTIRCRQEMEDAVEAALAKVPLSPPS